MGEVGTGAAVTVTGAAVGSGVEVSLLVPQATAINVATLKQAMVLMVVRTSSKLQPPDS